MARRLANIPGVVAIKEASGSVDAVSDIIAHTNGKLAVLSGDDSLTLPMMSVGAVGVVSVASNVVPELVVALVAAATRGDLPSARTAHTALYPLFKVLFVETNPVPAKFAMHSLGERASAAGTLDVTAACYSPHSHFPPWQASSRATHCVSLWSSCCPRARLR